ncbi:MAG: endonuclease III [Verrucomicrobia bacterium]|nr:endonuclease III [Verrucomicrobiota bacterium]
MNLKDRTSALIEAFRRTYPNAHCELVFAHPLQLLVATVLSAQCTDKRVNLVTETLFQRYRTAADFAQASQEELEEAIHSTGFFRNKAKAIRALAAALLAHHGGQVPADMEALTALPGVGRKTANVVLGNAFGKNEGIVVDTHVARLSDRLRLTPATSPEKIEADLMSLVPRQEWTNFSHWLIWHGRRRCTARNPDCAGCEVQTLCPSAFKVGRSKP